MDTPLARELGLEFPIFAFTHCRDVAAAVSKAGGMGILGVAAHSPKGLRAELEWIEKEVGGKPYGVDLLLPTKFVGSDRAGGFDTSELDARIPAEHRRFVDDLLARYDVPPLAPDAELRGELLVGLDKQREIIEMLFEYRIK
ncbi:nitronate monooxygenase, partial [Myxococcota bacterium]|nr:nitronate monooxygenase [Myxococcota bacterium]